MPTIARRTPTTEEAASYGYRDLLKDIIGKISTGATSNVERMTSGGMSEGEVLEMAMAPAGGMLKIAGTSKLLAGLLRKRLRAIPRLKELGMTEKAIESRLELLFRPARNVFKESLKVPEKEYRRIRGIDWGRMKGEALGTKGIFDPWGKKISLHPTLADIETVWHEFTHSRQWSPAKMSPMPGQTKWGVLEATQAQNLQELQEQLFGVARSGGMSASDFYRKVSPIERHARGVASVAKKYPKEFDILYKKGLESEVAYSRQKLHDLARALERQEELGMKYPLTGD